MSDVIEGDITKFMFPKGDFERQGAVYTIAKLSTGMVVKGEMIDPRLYQTYRFTGEVTADNRWGDYFKIDTYELVMPKTTDGIRDYLTTVHNIGPTRASALVEVYGDGTLDALVNTSPEQIVSEVVMTPALPLAVVEGLVTKLSSEQEYASIFVKLRKLFRNVPVTAKTLTRVIFAWKGDTMKNIKANPYQLMDFPRIGFKSADRVALRCGYPKDGAFRYLSATEHVLKTMASSGGHTFLRLNIAAQEASELIAQPAKEIREVLKNLDSDACLVKFRLSTDDPAYNGDLLALSLLHTHETKSVKILKKLMKADPFSVGKVDDIGLEKDQKGALQMIVDNPVSIVTGSPGTGKTFLIKRVLSSFQLAHTLLCAPTGKAAVRITEQTGEKASTIHRALNATYDEGEFNFGFNVSYPMPFNLVIVDEMSMVDTSLFYHLISSIGRGTRVVFVGDAHQLPSVGPGSVLRDLLSSCVVPHYELDIIKRQADNLLAQNLQCIKNGNEITINFDADDTDSDFLFVEIDEPEKIEEFIVKELSRREINNCDVQGPPGVQLICPHRSEKYELSTYHMNLAVLRSLGKETPDDRPIPFNVDDKVVQTRNDYVLDIYNGDVGFVRQVHSDKSLVVEFEDYERGGGATKLISIPAMSNDLQHAFALTVHKFQGSESPVVIIPMHTSFARQLMHRNLVYTAMSRAKTLCIIVGEVEALYSAIENEETERRKTLLSHLMVIED
jgi:exodeoxyribonuclease V alpha subunit